MCCALPFALHQGLASLAGQVSGNVILGFNAVYCTAKTIIDTFTHGSQNSVNWRGMPSPG